MAKATGLTSARAVVEMLHELQDETQVAPTRKRVAADEPVVGMRMRDLFATAKVATDLPLPEVQKLLKEPTYEARMAAFCILDFKARSDIGSSELCEMYLSNHDRVTTWDMVDRAAPRVVGGRVAGGPYLILQDLAAAADPLRRRSAITAPLFFAYNGTDDDLAAGFDIAEELCRDREPIVYNAVGIFLKHAGTREPLRLKSFLKKHSSDMARPAVRLAIAKLPREERARY